MYFKNLQPYRLSTEWPITAETLHEQLAKKPFHPCGVQDFESRGWVAPCDGGELVHAIGDDWLICLQVESKILPPAVINKEADKPAAKIPGTYVISDKVRAKLPELPVGETILFGTPEGNLQARDPRQAEIELKAVTTDAQPQAESLRKVG